MPEHQSIDEAIGRGLLFLSKSQEKDGSFVSFSSAKMWPFRRLRDWNTVFVPALMLTSLAGIDKPPAINIKNKLAGFLLKQKNKNWSFNYWSTTAREYTAQPYPNDLDDTFCALAGIYLHEPSSIDATALARIVKLLIATEAGVGGPYRTWLVPADSQPVWLDIDVAVNSNIAYFLSLIGNRLPRLNDLIGRAIAQDSFVSPYYPAPHAFIYYFARSYEGPEQGRLLNKARSLNRKAANDLERALCISARIRLGETRNLKPEVAKLLRSQASAGSWPAAGFYADPVKKGRLYYNGAPALTTAFVLETLQLYKQAINNQLVGPPKTGSKSYEKFRRKVLELSNEQCEGLNNDLKKAVSKALKQVSEGSNGSEIILLADNFQRSLRSPIKNLPPSFSEKLGLANLYGWLAYTIYDDFLDEEGKPELIPVANVSMRRSLDNFSGILPADSGFSNFVGHIFDVIDSANSWESRHCRFKVQDGIIQIGRLPDYGKNMSKLAERSLGHALPPMAVLVGAGQGLDTAEAANLLKAFRHYLIARQLNDDAHDWSDDLQNGHITVVVSRLLKELKVKPGEHSLDKLLKSGRSQFWHTTLPGVCQLMQEQVKLSRRFLKNVRTFKSANGLSDLLGRIEESITSTLQQQKEAEDFLRQYKQPNGK